MRTACDRPLRGSARVGASDQHHAHV